MALRNSNVIASFNSKFFFYFVISLESNGFIHALHKRSHNIPPELRSYVFHIWYVIADNEIIIFSGTYDGRLKYIPYIVVALKRVS